MILCGDKTTGVGGGDIGAGGGCPLLEGYWVKGGEGRAGHECICNNERRSLGFRWVTV